MKSFLRREEYKFLRTLQIDGSILDVGGSRASNYHPLIGGEHTITVANISDAHGVDVIFDAQEHWPLEDDRFDAVLFVNVLEHLYRHEKAIQEAGRVLKEGGMVAGVVPFMFNVHASPNDHFRYTRSTLERMFKENGFTDVEVVELGTGAFSVVYHCLVGFVRWDWLADLLIPVFAGMDRIVHAIKPDNKMSAKEMPLGYAFKARRARVL